MIPIRGLDNDNIEWIKIPETKNATTFVLVSTNTLNYICVAIKKTLLLFEITRKKCRYSFSREIQMALNIQSLNCCKSSLIAVGTASNFIVYNLSQRESPPLCMPFGFIPINFLIIEFDIRFGESRMQRIVVFDPKPNRRSNVPTDQR